MEITLAAETKPDAIVRLSPEEARLLRQFCGDLLLREVEGVLGPAFNAEATHKVTSEIYDKLDDLGY